MPSVPKPPLEELEKAGLTQFARWISSLHHESLRHTMTIRQELSPTPIAGLVSEIKTFTVKGLKTDDIVSVNKPTNTSNIHIQMAWVENDDELSIKYFNSFSTTTSIPSEIYKIIATRVSE